MTEYCTASDVEKRLTAAGYEHMADDDGDGHVSEDDTAASITNGIEYAGNFIDSYIQARVNINSARNSGNKWLRDRAIDIAVYRISSNGGRDEVEAFKDDFNTTKELLERVRDDGDGIPGLSIDPSPYVDGRREIFEIHSEWTT